MKKIIEKIEDINITEMTVEEYDETVANIVGYCPAFQENLITKSLFAIYNGTLFYPIIKNKKLYYLLITFETNCYEEEESCYRGPIYIERPIVNIFSEDDGTFKDIYKKYLQLDEELKTSLKENYDKAEFCSSAKNFIGIRD